MYGNLQIYAPQEQSNTTGVGIGFAALHTSGNHSYSSIKAFPSPYDIEGNLKVHAKNGLVLQAGDDDSNNYMQALTDLGVNIEHIHMIADSNVRFYTGMQGVSTLACKAEIDGSGNITNNGNITSSGNITGVKVYGAVWNDYAEYRNTKTPIDAGRVVVEVGDDSLVLANDRLQPGANVVSDTYGFAIGKTEHATTPIAVSGRVLAYPWEPRATFKAGDPVCSGPNGTVSKMTREEVMMYPDRIIGTVSAVPTYETWGESNVPVNGRIWIKIK